MALFRSYIFTQAERGPGKWWVMHFNHGAGYGTWIFNRRWFIPGVSVYIRLRKPQDRAYHKTKLKRHYPALGFVRNPNLYLD